LRLIKSDEEDESREELGGQMSFLDHLDELRTRLIRSMAFVLIAAFACWWVSGYIYRFLERPVQHALNEAQQQRKVTIAGLTESFRRSRSTLFIRTKKYGLFFPN